MLENSVNDMCNSRAQSEPLKMPQKRINTHHARELVTGVK